MLTLLRDLRRLRREIGLTRPDRPRSLTIRHVDAGSCNGCEHELTLTQKLRRKPIAQKYASEIEALYAPSPGPSVHEPTAESAAATK